MSKELCDGMKIYDTPYFDRGAKEKASMCGYNSSFKEGTPTYSVGSNCQHTAYWERTLFREILSVLDFTIPDNWDRDYTLWVLFRNGYFAILKNARVQSRDKKDNYTADIPQACGLAGINVFYQPVRVVVANHLIKPQEWRIGKNCAVIKLTPDYSGIWDVVHHYAETLGMMTQSLRMAIINTRIVDGYGVTGKAGAETVKRMLSCAEQGSPTFITLLDNTKDSDGAPVAPWVEFHNEVGRNYLVDKIIEDMEKTLDEFRRMIGIPTLSDKKERQITNEVNTVIGSAQTELDVYMDCLTRSIEQAKKVFPDLSFNVKRARIDNGGESNAV